MEQKPLQITAQQALQITDSVLAQMLTWIDGKLGEPNNHDGKTLDARKSLFHARLLLGVKHREMIQEAVKAQQKVRPLLQRPLPTIDENLISVGRGY
jgi:hypothetical protein